MGKTKKTKSTARFGARYGKGIKEGVKKHEGQKKFECPQCGKKSVKRTGYATWECSKCGAKFAGGTYKPQTEPGRIAARMIKAPQSIETEEVTEKESD